MNSSIRPFDPVFGTEIEFVVLLEKDKAFWDEFEEFVAKNPYKSVARGLHMNYVLERTFKQHAKALRAGGLSNVIFSNMPEKSEPESFVIKPETGLISTRFDPETTADVRMANGANLTIQTDDYVWVEIEVNTPALRMKDAKSFRQVRKALETIKSFPGTLVTKNCGLHVHVSDYDREYDLETLRNFLFLIILAQKQMAQFHSKDRMANNTCRFPELLFWDWEKCDLGPGDLVHVISGIESLDEMLDFLDGGGKYRRTVSPTCLPDRTPGVTNLKRVLSNIGSIVRR